MPPEKIRQSPNPGVSESLDIRLSVNVITFDEDTPESRVDPSPTGDGDCGVEQLQAKECQRLQATP